MYDLVVDAFQQFLNFHFHRYLRECICCGRVLSPLLQGDLSSNGGETARSVREEDGVTDVSCVGVVSVDRIRNVLFSVC